MAFIAGLRVALRYSLDTLDTLSTDHPEPSHSPHPPVFTALLQITALVPLHHYKSLRPICSLLDPGPDSLISKYPIQSGLVDIPAL